MADKAYDRVWWRGVKLTARHRNAMRWAEKRWQKKFPGLTIQPAQGSWSGAAASAGTHSGAGAIDIRTKHLTSDQRIALVRAIKDAGQAAWYRPNNWDGKGGGEHIHALDIGGQTGMDSGAKQQIRSFDQKRNGLRNNAADNTYRPSPKVKFSYPQNKPIPR